VPSPIERSTAHRSNIAMKLHHPIAAFALLAGAAACTNGVTFPARETAAYVPSRPNTSGQASSYGATAPGAPGGTSTRPIQVDDTVVIVDEGPRSDGQILTVLAALDRREVELSRLVERRSANASVRAYASGILARRNQATVDRQKYATYANTSFQRIERAGAVREATSESVGDLSGLSGHEFDEEYLDAVIQSKEETIEFIDNQALVRAIDPRLRAMLRSQRRTTERELRAAEALRDRLGEGSSS
jgi:predicted outer membrane protein